MGRFVGGRCLQALPSLFIISIVVLMIGTLNVRLAARRAERRKGRPE